MNGLFVIVIIAILSIRIKHKSADHMKKTLLHNILGKILSKNQKFQDFEILKFATIFFTVLALATKFSRALPKVINIFL